MPRGTLDTAGSLQDSRTRLSRSLAGLSRTFLLPLWIPYAVRTPEYKTQVWALPRSLAATYGIVITFSSSGYLDVSVRRVPSILLCIQSIVSDSVRRVSPFRNLRINACLQLPEAFRSLPRLSSAPSARASALRSCKLNLSALSSGSPGSTLDLA